MVPMHLPTSGLALGVKFYTSLQIDVPPLEVVVRGYLGQAVNHLGGDLLKVPWGKRRCKEGKRSQDSKPMLLILANSECT
jgi:hypothetical protein